MHQRVPARVWICAGISVKRSEEGAKEGCSRACSVEDARDDRYCHESGEAAQTAVCTATLSLSVEIVEHVDRRPIQVTDVHFVFMHSLTSRKRQAFPPYSFRQNMNILYLPTIAFRLKKAHVSI